MAEPEKKSGKTRPVTRAHIVSPGATNDNVKKNVSGGQANFRQAKPKIPGEVRSKTGSHKTQKTTSSKIIKAGKRKSTTTTMLRQKTSGIIRSKKSITADDGVTTKKTKSGSTTRMKAITAKDLKRSTGKHSVVKGKQKSSKSSTRLKSIGGKGVALVSDTDLQRASVSEESMDSPVLQKKGLGLAAKFSIPVCLLIAFAIGVWGFWVGRTFYHSTMNGIKKSGVREVTNLALIGKQMLIARREHLGAWPIITGAVSQRELALEFGLDLEKKSLELGYKNVKEVIKQVENFSKIYAINKNNQFKELSDLTRALGFKDNGEALQELSKIKSEYRNKYGSDVLSLSDENYAKFTVLAKDEIEWSGMADAPVVFFDLPELSAKIDTYVREKGVLASLIKIKVKKSDKGASNEVLDGYVVDTIRDILLAGTNPTGVDTEIEFQPARENISSRLSIAGSEITPEEVNISWGTFRVRRKKSKKIISSEPALLFDCPIALSGGARLGKAYLALSAKRIDKDKLNLQLVMGGIGLTAVLVAIGICLVIARRVTAPVKTLIMDMDIVAQGDLTHKTVAHSSDEIGAIARQFNEMTNKLLYAQQMEKEAQRIEDELERAKEIQLGLLPAKTPKIKGLDIYATYHPAREVGGDYYDFYAIDKEHLGIVVADVAGKGIPGSMVMGTTRTILRFSAANNPSAANTLAKTNQVVAADIRRGMFVTALYVVLNARSHKMLVSSAGHNPLAIYRTATDSIDLVNPNGIALGFDKGPLFQRTIKEESVNLGKGDRVVLYTDGVVEAMNEQNDEYTSERFYDFIKENSELNSHEFVDTLLDDLNEHKGNAEQHDDITIVTFRIG